MATGMPQLDFASYPSQIFWSILLFSILYYLVGKATKKISEVISSRSSMFNKLRDEIRLLENSINDLVSEKEQSLSDIKKRSEEMLLQAKRNASEYMKTKLEESQKNLEKQSLKIKEDQVIMEKEVMEYRHDLAFDIFCIYYSELLKKNLDTDSHSIIKDELMRKLEIK